MASIGIFFSIVWYVNLLFIYFFISFPVYWVLFRSVLGWPILTRFTSFYTLVVVLRGAYLVLAPLTFTVLKESRYCYAVASVTTFSFSNLHAEFRSTFWAFKRLTTGLGVLDSVTTPIHSLECFQAWKPAQRRRSTIVMRQQSPCCSLASYAHFHDVALFFSPFQTFFLWRPRVSLAFL